MGLAGCLRGAVDQRRQARQQRPYHAERIPRQRIDIAHPENSVARCRERGVQRFGGGVKRRTHRRIGGTVGVHDHVAVAEVRGGKVLRIGLRLPVAQGVDAVRHGSRIGISNGEQNCLTRPTVCIGIGFRELGTKGVPATTKG